MRLSKRLRDLRIPHISYEEKNKLQLHVPSQPFQASMARRSERVVLGFVPGGNQGCHSLC